MVLCGQDGWGPLGRWYRRHRLRDGSRMIVFLAGLQAVPVELYDAAKIDSANAWHCFRNVTLPLISPTIFFNVVISVIGALSVFSVA
jgi:ABC-type sugar transport system permease subunit